MTRAAKKPATVDAAKARRRGMLLLSLFALGALTAEARLFYLQHVESDFLAAQAQQRHVRKVEIAAHRATITDRNGEPLAVSTPVDSIYANPQELREALDRLPDLAKALGEDADELARKVTSNLDQQFVYLKRALPPTESEKVLSLGLPGVGAQREYRRYYPAAEVAGHLLGFTNVDDEGQEAIELALDHWLAGESGEKRVQRDNLGRVVRDLELVTPAKPGRDVRLSIDLSLQYIAYRELEAEVRKQRALGGSLVMLDPHTGEVLAMVNQPEYNPNNRAQLKPELYRNRAVTDYFEPGSSFKPFPLAAALESGLVAPETIVDTSPGKIVIANRVITEDSHDLGSLPLIDAFAQSSNVAAATVALEVEPEAIWTTLSSFGIGRVTGSAFPGESAGKLNDWQHWRRIDHATISYGYGVGVTALQLARAYGAIAADGVLMPVSLLALDEPPQGERVLSVETARDLRAMLEAVVALPIGSGKRAAVPHYRVAGKTGTSQKAEAGGHSAQRHTAIFAGFVPASEPRVVIVVVIDEPQGDAYYGGDIAAPVFAAVASDTLRALAVAPDALADPPLTVVAQAPARVTP